MFNTIVDANIYLFLNFCYNRHIILIMRMITCKYYNHKNA